MQHKFNPNIITNVYFFKHFLNSRPKIFGYWWNFAFMDSFWPNEQKTKCENKWYNFTDATVHSGVAQGSHLGWLLFNIFLNYLPTILKYSLILLFAYDAKIYFEIKSMQDCISFQEDIHEIVSWLTQNKLKLNSKKCSFISISCFKTTTTTTKNRLYLSN